MLLPSELLLDLLHCVDYNTLVPSKFVGSTFLHLINRHSALLALPHHFRILVYTAWITVDNATTGARTTRVRYERDDHASLTAAFIQVAETVGQHTVLQLMFSENTWALPGLDAVFAAAPVLKYAHNVGLYSPALSQPGSPATFLPIFPCLQSLRVSITADIFGRFDWAFLSTEPTRDLQYLKLTVMQFDGSYDAYYELLRLWLALPPLPDGAERVFDFRENDFPADFISGVIAMLRSIDKNATVMLRTKRDGPFMDAHDYNIVDGGQNTTRYEANAGDVTLEIDVHLVIVRKKRFAPAVSQNLA